MVGSASDPAAGADNAVVANDLNPPTKAGGGDAAAVVADGKNPPPPTGRPWGLRRMCTLSNLLTAIMLWEVVSRFWPASSKKPANSTPMPPTEQHFSFHPVGFSYTSPIYKPDPEAEDGVGASNKFKVRGFYEKDSLALVRATQNILFSKAREATETWEKEEFPTNVSFTTGAGTVTSAGKDDNNADITIVISLKLGMDPQREISYLRHAVTFLIGFHEDGRSFTRDSMQLEVILVLDSQGGSVGAYGLLADQLGRLRAIPGITLTVACDQTALSGGYMLAALATPGHLLAAPFASIGSIGAKTTELFNVREALEQWGIKSMRFKGGKYKDPTSMFADISDDEKEHMQRHIDSFHQAFSDHVRKWRGEAVQDYEYVTSGAYWMGKTAKDLGLVDQLLTSDEYIDQKIRAGGKVLRLAPQEKSQEKKGLLASLVSLFWPGLSSRDEEQNELTGKVSFGDVSLSQSIVRHGLIGVRVILSKVLHSLEGLE